MLEPPSIRIFDDIVARSLIVCTLSSLESVAAIVAAALRAARRSPKWSGAMAVLGGAWVRTGTPVPCSHGVLSLVVFSESAEAAVASEDLCTFCGHGC